MKTVFRQYGINGSSVLLLIMTLFSEAIIAQNANNLPQLESQNMLIDGRLDEPQWQQAVEIRLNYEVSPANNSEAAQSTVAYLFEDGQNLYVAVKANDDGEKEVRAYLRDRDKIDDGDWISIKLDTFNDKRRAFEFRVNPLGIQADLKIDETDSGADNSWDAIWYSGGEVTDSGYNVEMKIPLSVLRFESDTGAKDWGFQISRSWPRDVAHLFSNIKIDRNKGCEICQFGSLTGFAALKSSDSFAVIPTITGIKSEFRDIGEQWQTNGVDYQFGLDGRWSPNQNSVINATFNPDYSQIEADSLQLQVNNVNALFFREKRSFFLDGADYFNSWSRLIYTRLFTKPNYGIKYTTKNGNHRVGLYAVEDDNTYFLLPGSQRSRIVKLNDLTSTNIGLRYRYEMGDSGNLGSTFTRRTADGYDSNLLGVDGKIWFSEADYLRFQGMHSSTDYPNSVSQVYGQSPSTDGNAYSFLFNHENDYYRGFVKRHYFSEGFRADSGFISRGDWTQDTAGGSKTWHADDEKSWWDTFTIYTDWWRSETVKEGIFLNRANDLHFVYTGKHESEFTLQLRKAREQFGGQIFELTNGTIFGEFVPMAGVNVYLENARGDAIDYEHIQPATEDTRIVAVNWQISESFNVDLSYTFQKFTVAAGELFKEQLLDTKITYQFDEQQSLRLIVQTSREDLQIGSGLFDPSEQPFAADRGNQLLYSYKINPLSLFYIGYSDAGFKDSDHPSFFLSDRTLFAKVSYAWQN